MNTNVFSRTAKVLSTACALSFLVTATSNAGIIYVDADSGCISNCGGSWASAHPDLQSALSAAVSNDQIWVADGTYKPTSGSDRTISFDLITGVSVYGGFNGTESTWMIVIG